MKPWPDEAPMYEDVVRPILKILRKVANKVSGKLPKLEYDGYDFQSASLSDPEWHFSKEGIEYHKERDRDIFDIIVLMVFNLGYKQGSEIEKKNTKFWQRAYEEMRERYDSVKLPRR